MQVVIGLLRAVNVGGHNKIKMDALRAICGSLGFRDARTYLQSGNVVFGTAQNRVASAAAQLEDAIEGELKFRPVVILRTATELRKVVASNPFSGRTGVAPNKLHVSFLVRDPGKEARDLLPTIVPAGVELHSIGRELYIYFPDGAGNSKLTPALLDRTLRTSGTARNWNTVSALLAMAEGLGSPAAEGGRDAE